MPDHEQKRMNALLSDPDQVNVAHLLQDGRIGLFVVSALARRRHGIAVRLQSNIYGGTQAVLVLPQSLLGADPTPRRRLTPCPYRPRRRAPAARRGREPGRPTAERHTPDRVPGLDARCSGPRGPGSRTRGDRGPIVAPGIHRRPHQTPGPARNGRPWAALGRGPAPPLRAERIDRPTPHASPPERGGPSAAAGHEREDRSAPAAVHERAHAAPSPARPELPRRTNQESLVPQLREAPAPRVEDEHALARPWVSWPPSGAARRPRRGSDRRGGGVRGRLREPDATTGTGGQTALDAPWNPLAAPRTRSHRTARPAGTGPGVTAGPRAAGGRPARTGHLPARRVPARHRHVPARQLRRRRSRPGAGEPGAFAGEPSCRARPSRNPAKTPPSSE